MDFLNFWGFFWEQMLLRPILASDTDGEVEVTRK